MAKKKKKTRKELLKEPDEFMTVTGKAIRFVSDNQKPISYGLYALIAFVLIFFGYQFFAQRAEKKAFLKLEQTLVKYEASKKATSPAEAFGSVSEEFQRIVDKYGGNAGGKLARVSYANVSYNAGQYQMAIELYKQSLNDFKDDEFIYNLILSGLGYAYQHIADDRNAVVYFEKIAAATNSSIPITHTPYIITLYKKN
jgi:predicted negative regulator of RcsB-dependent stress response